MGRHICPPTASVQDDGHIIYAHSKHVIEEFVKETKFCAREQIDMTVRRCLVILKVNFMIKLMMRRHVLSLFSQEHIEEVLYYGSTMGVDTSSDVVT